METVKYIELLERVARNHRVDTYEELKALKDVASILKNHKPHKVHFAGVHLGILIKVFNHVVHSGSNEFKKSDLPNLTRAEYGNFYMLQRFGLLYFPLDDDGKRKKGGHWGIDRKRVYDFLNGDFKIAEYYIRDKLTKKNYPSEEKITVHGIKNSTNAFEKNLPDFVTYNENDTSI